MTLSGLLTLLLSSPELLLALGGGIGALLLYLKGRRDKAADIKQDQQEARDSLNKDVRKAESQNQGISVETSKKLLEIANAPLTKVLEMLNEFGKKK